MSNFKREPIEENKLWRHKLLLKILSVLCFKARFLITEVVKKIKRLSNVKP